MVEEEKKVKNKSKRGSYIKWPPYSINLIQTVNNFYFLYFNKKKCFKITK